jgi:hypothetical protein
MPVSRDELSVMIKLRIDRAAKAMEFDGHPAEARFHLQRALGLCSHWDRAPSDTELRAIMGDVAE